MSIVHFRSPAAPRPVAAGGAPLAGLRVYLDSLGCAKNLVDSEATLGLLFADGATAVADAADADLLVVNTCGFLEQAREESIERILELAQLKTVARPRVLAVLGCLVARAADELQESIPEVDVWLPAGQHGDLPSRVAARLAALPPESLRQATDRSGSGRAPASAFTGFGARVLLTPGHTAYLKISEGCTNACTFCSIPLMRGLQRSRPLADIVAEARGLAAGGVRELHVVAQDLTHYGFDLEARRDLLHLMEALSAVDGIEWIRLLYAHPAHLTPRLLDGLFQVPKMVRYLDMPVQHASAAILQAMRRPYTAERVREQLARLRETVPGITLRSTVIVGFPGESERDFDTLCEFIAAVRYERLGIFTYSREPGTPAADLPGRPRATTAARRLHTLTELQMGIAAEHAAGRVGARVRVLVDGLVNAEEAAETPLARGAAFRARSEGEALDIDGVIYVEGTAAGVEPGQFLDVRITAADVFDLRARPEAPGARQTALVS